ncbi:hypothetical protein CJF30_00001950 [Rutstroemia sp. NJR-2017a BBW]|nr:hypothetical protein CJF30_00001950 [Rutstroemia sp. NJR-2017a BBW]
MSIRAEERSGPINIEAKPFETVELSPPIFCCGNVQRVQNSAPPAVHAYTTRVAFFADYISHPTVASYVVPPNARYPAGYFTVPPESFPEPIPSPAPRAESPPTAQPVHKFVQQPQQQQLQQQQQPMGTWTYPQNPFHIPLRPIYTPAPPPPPPPTPLTYTIPPTTPLPLPRFQLPSSPLNVKFRLERYRTTPPQPWEDRKRDDLELVWYYWPVQLQIPTFAQGNPADPVQQRMMVEQGVQIINGERWGFVMDNLHREGLWHKRRCYKLFVCKGCERAWKVTVFIRRGY